MKKPLRFKGLDRKAIRKEGMKPIPLMGKSVPQIMTDIKEQIDQCSQNQSSTKPLKKP